MGRKGRKDRGTRPLTNQAQNQQVRDAAKQAGLNEDERWAFRRTVEDESRQHGANLSYDDLMKIALEVRNGA